MATTVVPGCQFAIDNTAPVSLAAWAALERCNVGHEPSYGTDAWTDRACNLIRDQAREQNLILEEEQTLDNGDVVIVLSERG